MPSEEKIINSLKTHLQYALSGIWLKNFGKVTVEVKKDHRLQGATDAYLYRVFTKANFVVKHDYDDVPKEKRGYEILKNASPSLRTHLVPPLEEGKNPDGVRYLNEAILLTPHINSLTLHKIISKKKVEKNYIYTLHSDFLNRLKNLWSNTRNSTKPNIGKIYLVERLDERLRKFKDFYNLKGNLKIILNKQEIELTRKIIPDLQKKLLSLKDKINYSCTIHGDEHAKNILVREESIGKDSEAWVLIDYTNTQEESDWIISIAKILYWFKVYFVIENARKKNNLHDHIKKVSSNTLRIEYNANNFRKRIPEICNELYCRTLDFCNKANKEIFYESNYVWKERLKIALFIILFGSVTRHFEPEKKFAIPFLIGESFRFLESL